MVKAYAINTVTICTKPGERSADGRTSKPAVLEDKPAGTVFDCPDDDYEAFEAAGAVRKPTKAELAEAPAAEVTKPVASTKV